MLLTITVVVLVVGLLAYASHRQRRHAGGMTVDEARHLAHRRGALESGG